MAKSNLRSLNRLRVINLEIERLQASREFTLLKDLSAVNDRIDELDIHAATIIEARGKARLDALQADFQQAIQAAKAYLGET